MSKSSFLKAVLRTSSYTTAVIITSLGLLSVERSQAGTVGPVIFVTKNCSTSLVVLCNSNSASINFSGIVGNSGAGTATNIVVTDDLVGGTVFSLGSLAPGQTRPWSANFTVTSALCGRSNIVNTATATGRDALNPAITTTDTATCSFSVVCSTTPSLSVTKACASPVVTNVSSSLTVTGQVCNTGLIDLTNVIVVDAQPGTPISATNLLGDLEAGECKPYSFTYTATSCDPNRDTVTAIGSPICGSLPVTATASATCFLCCPGITIQKLVACLLPGANCPPNSSDYRSEATGVKGNTGDPTQDNPAFCYIIVVRNTGHDPLTNIVIRDDKLGALGTFPGPLAVGGTITISNLRTNWATTTTNFASVTAQCGRSGVSPGNGAQVGASTFAIANVEPADLVCQKLVSVNGSTPAPEFSSCAAGGTNTVTWYASVTNTGQATLCGIHVTELGSGPDLLPCGAVNFVLTNCLAPGEGTGLIPLCTVTYGAAGTNIENSIRVTAFVAGVSNACAINNFGSNIVVSSQCSARLSFSADTSPPQVTCRAGVNPSDKKIPTAGKNPSSGQNPDGYYQLIAKDDCDANPTIYVADSGSDFVAGPFASGDVIKLTQSPGRQPGQDSAPAPIVAHLHFKGDGLLFAVDANGNASEPVLCLVPRPAK